MKSEKTRKIIMWVLIAFIIINVAFIWSNSLLSKENSADVSGKFFDVLKPILDPILKPFVGESGLTPHLVRKMAHWSEFFALGTFSVLLVFFMDKHKIWQYIAGVLVFGLIIAGIDETIQIFSNRGPSFKDVMIDYWGYITAIVLFYAVYLIVNAVRKRNKNKEQNNTDR